MTAKELAQDKSTADLKKTTWFKDAFSNLDLNQSKVKKPPAPLPEALFDLGGEWSIKRIHKHHMNQTTTTAWSPPPKTGSMELVNMANLDMRTLHLHPMKKGRTRIATKRLMKHPPPLVLKKVKMSARPMADSCHQLLSLVHGEGTATGVKWSVSIQAQDQSQQ